MKKINIGIILLIIVTVVYIVYFALYEKGMKDDKENVLQFLDEYFEVHNKYSKLEKDDRVLDKEIDEEKYNRYLAEMKQQLSKYALPETLDKLYLDHKNKLDMQKLGAYMDYEYDRKVDKIIYYKAFEDTIFMYLGLNISVDKDSRVTSNYNFFFDDEKGRYIGDVKNKKGEDYQLEGIVLKKVGKEYKVLHHMIMDKNEFSFETGNPMKTDYQITD